MDLTQQVAVPKGALIAPIQIKGDQMGLHIDRHGQKLGKNVGDCGIDLFPMKLDRVEEIQSRAKSLLGKLAGKPPNWDIIYVSTGVTMTIVAGCYLFVTPRSSTAKLVPCATALTGIIDAGYTGEILLRFSCHSYNLDETIEFINEAIEKKVALAQAIPHQFAYPQFWPVEGNIIIPPGMGRGAAGFGSTDQPQNNGG